ncbi:hypothetical protein ES332_A10G092100v1 [Gossypium tomentosum]|uniref:Uncharacterized protein n=1 Tax=Gossypium tomentosum TaxID=34277 RepID=A0A5D2NR83_GOSTO|nr:hypothetical protein ES332_A10G092100v1 [Gossypium tomentosum]
MLIGDIFLKGERQGLNPPFLLDHAERRRKLQRRGHGADLAHEGQRDVHGRFGATGEWRAEPRGPCMPRAHMEAQHPKLLGFLSYFVFWAVFCLGLVVKWTVVIILVFV